MKRIQVIAVALVFLTLPVAIDGQRLVKQTETIDYVLTVENDSPDDRERVVEAVCENGGA